MSKSWNFNPKDRVQDGARKVKRPQPSKSKSEQRREERALRTGDVDQFYEDDDDEVIYFDDDR